MQRREERGGREHSFLSQLKMKGWSILPGDGWAVAHQGEDNRRYRSAEDPIWRWRRIVNNNPDDRSCNKILWVVHAWKQALKLEFLAAWCWGYRRICMAETTELMSAGHLQCKDDEDDEVERIHFQNNVTSYNLWVVIQEKSDGVCRIGIGCRHLWLWQHCCKLTEGSAWHVEHSQEEAH